MCCSKRHFRAWPRIFVQRQTLKVFWFFSSEKNKTFFGLKERSPRFFAALMKAIFAGSLMARLGG